MQQRLTRAQHYRKQANRYADLARQTVDPGFLIELYRTTAVRYVLMAEELERYPEPRRPETGGWTDSLPADLHRRAEALLERIPTDSNQPGTALVKTWRQN